MQIGNKSARQWWREYRGSVVFLVLMLTFRSAWADWLTVPTGSMNPTIVEGDRIVVNKHVYGVRIPWTLVRVTDGQDPQRGEIVVFDSPVTGISLVKRVIGVPGDTIALDEGGLVVNGEHARYANGDVAHLAPLLETTREQSPAVYRERGPIREHDVMRLPFGSPRQFMQPVVVPDGMYFMLGDNRDNSADSRYIGFVPRRNIVGRASSVAISFNPENYYLPRSGRFNVALE
ncbi:MAG TPA: signal peptidase I [Steroidobacteraceae bacterium]|nr:signal peptidase I [Steroidobacteraceae bacterium]